MNMGFYIGLFAVAASIILAFLAEGGKLSILFQPYATLMIVGSGIGIYILANPKSILKSTWVTIKRVRGGAPYKKEDYLMLLSFMFFFFRHAHAHGALQVERDVENPHNSAIFKEFPEMLKKREALVLFCDYMRMYSMGFSRTYELENLIEEQINIRRHYSYEISNALFKLADALPALGIIAAILGVVNAMGSIGQSPEIMGHKIGAALMGTFIGIVTSYCIVAPLSSYLEKFGNEEAKFLECIKAGIVSFVNGNSPIIATEFARQTVPVSFKPSFVEVEKSIERYRANRKVKKHGR